MAIDLQAQRVTLKLASPMQTSYGTLAERELVAVRLTDEDGVTGFGEAAPLEPYDGVSIGRTLRALSRYREVLASFDGQRRRSAGDPAATPGDPGTPAAAARSEAEQGTSGANLLDACRSIDPLPQALAAIDLALWDRAGRREGKPVCSLLVDDPAPTVEVNASLTAIDRAGAAREAAKAVEEGFRCLKVKVGVGDDAGRVAAVRVAAGHDVALRLDANGAWNVEEAVQAINALSATGLELVEEPTHGLAGVRRVRDRVPVRIAIDETAAEPGALTSGAADAVCLKISRCGGISGLLAAAALVRASGAEVYVASTYDGPLGIAGAVHAAAALASRGPLAPCGLATMSMFHGLRGRLPAMEGEVAVPDGPGLGTDPL